VSGELGRAARKRQYVLLPARRAAGPPAGEELERVARSAFGRSRRELIAEAAYYRSLHRGSGPADRERDWLEAEAEIEALLRRPIPI
jgi:hypothetical protein